MTSVVKERALLGREWRGQPGGEEVTVSDTAKIFVEEFARCCFGGMDGCGKALGSGLADVAGAENGGDISCAQRIDLDKVEIYNVNLNDINLET